MDNNKKVVFKTSQEYLKVKVYPILNVALEQVNCKSK